MNAQHYYFNMTFLMVHLFHAEYAPKSTDSEKKKTCQASIFQRQYTTKTLRSVSKISNLKTFKVARRDARYQIWDVKCLKDGQRKFLKSLENKGAITICKEQTSRVNLMVEGNRAVVLEKMLRDRDITFAIAITDLATRAAPPSPPPRIRGITLSSGYRSPTKRVLDWKDYYPLPMINKFMEDLEGLFPSICTVDVIGKSVEGRDIKMLKISNSDSKNSGIWLDGTIHAREWISTSVVTFIADYIARNFSNLPKNITNKDWFFVPVVNPDGYVHTHTGDRMWRKNRYRLNNTVVGVDLNRNFSGSFSRLTPDVTYDDPTHLNYRGVEPFSEPETAAIKDFLLYSATPFKIFLTFHSYSEVISFPWCNTNEPCPDYVTLLEGATVMAKAIYQTTGRMYKVGGFKDIMYTACGTSIDWSYGTAHIPFSYLLELRGKTHKFLLPKEEILDCCKESLNAVLALTEFVDKYKCQNCIVLSKTTR